MNLVNISAGRPIEELTSRSPARQLHRSHLPILFIILTWPFLTREPSLGQEFPSERIEPAILLERAAKAARSSDNPNWREIALSEIATIQVKLGNAQGALQTLTALKNVPTASAILPALVKAQVAQGNLSSAETTAEKIADDFQKSQAITDIAIGYANHSDLRGALRIVVSGVSAARKDFVLQNLANNRLDQRDFAGAVVIVSAIENSRVKVETLKRIVAAQVASGDVKGIDDTIKRVGQIEKNYDGRSQIAIAKFIAGDVRAAFRIVSAIDNPNERDSVLTEIALTQAEKGDWSGARQTTNRIVGVDRKDRTLGRILAVSLKRGEVQSAARVARELRPSQENSNILFDLLKAQLIAGGVKDAFETADTIADPATKIFAFREIAIAQAKMGNIAGAFDTLNIYANAGGRWIDAQIAATLPELADAEAKTGTVARSLQAAEKIEFPLHRHRSLHAIAAALTKAGKKADAIAVYQQSLQVAGTINDEREYFSAHLSTAVALAEAGERSSAQNLFDEAANLISRMANLNRKAQSYSTLVHSYLHVGDIKNALEIVKIAGKLSQGHQLLRDVIVAQVRTGDIDAAIEIARDWAGPSNDNLYLLQIPIKEILYQGAIALALRVGQMIEESQSRANALRLVALYQANIGNGHAALGWITDEDSPFVKSMSLIGVAEGLLRRGEGKPPPTREEEPQVISMPGIRF